MKRRFIFEFDDSDTTFKAVKHALLKLVVNGKLREFSVKDGDNLLITVNDGSNIKLDEVIPFE